MLPGNIKEIIGFIVVKDPYCFYLASIPSSLVQYCSKAAPLNIFQPNDQISAENDAKFSRHVWASSKILPLSYIFLNDTSSNVICEFQLSSVSSLLW